MKCQKCGKNEASVLYSETTNGQRRKIHLCGACAHQQGLGGSFASAFPSFSGFGSLWQSLAASAPNTERSCPTCGLTERELRRTGRVGCADCYAAFADVLNSYIKQVHGATQHIGAAPAPSTLDALREKLKAAVQNEDFEQAAGLRDEIRRLEGEQK